MTTDQTQLRRALADLDDMAQAMHARLCEIAFFERK